MLRLPEKQELVWEMSLRGKGVVEIAKKLGISKQAVSMYLKQARAKLSEIFLDLANFMDLSIVKMDVRRGILIGNIKQTGERVFIFYIPFEGPMAIYESVLKTGKCTEDINCLKVIQFYRELLGIKYEDITRSLRETLKYAETV